MWDTGNAVGDISGATKRVNSVDFRPKRPFRVVAGSEDFTVSLYEGPVQVRRHRAQARELRQLRAFFRGRDALRVRGERTAYGVIYDGETGAPLAPTYHREARSGRTKTRTTGTPVPSTRARGRRADARVLTVGADKPPLSPLVLRRRQMDPEPGPFPTVRAPPRVSVRGFAKEPGVGDMQVGCTFVAGKRASRSPRRRRSRASCFRRRREEPRVSETMETVRVRRRHGKSWATPSFADMGNRGRGSAASSERVPRRGLGALGDGAGQTPFAGPASARRPDETGTRTEEEIPGDGAGRAWWFSLAATRDGATPSTSRRRTDDDEDGDEDGNDAFDVGVLPAQPRDVDDRRTPTSSCRPPPPPARRYSAAFPCDGVRGGRKRAHEGGARVIRGGRLRRTGTSSRSGARTVRCACSADVATLPMGEHRIWKTAKRNPSRSTEPRCAGVIPPVGSLGRWRRADASREVLVCTTSASRGRRRRTDKMVCSTARVSPRWRGVRTGRGSPPGARTGPSSCGTPEQTRRREGGGGRTRIREGHRSWMADDARVCTGVSTRACGRGEREEETRRGRYFAKRAARSIDPIETRTARDEYGFRQNERRRHIASVRAVRPRRSYASRPSHLVGFAAERARGRGRAARRARRVKNRTGGKDTSASPRGVPKRQKETALFSFRRVRVERRERSTPTRAHRRTSIRSARNPQDVSLV